MLTYVTGGGEIFCKPDMSHAHQQTRLGEDSKGLGISVAGASVLWGDCVVVLVSRPAAPMEQQSRPSVSRMKGLVTCGDLIWILTLIRR